MFLVIVLSGAAFGQSANPADWYWTSPLVGGGCNVCAFDESGAIQSSVPYNGTLSSMRMIKHADGSVWAADVGSFKLVQFINNAIGLDIFVWMITNLCTDPVGQIWTSRGSLFVPITIEKRDASGTVLPQPSSWTLPPSALNVVDMRSDPAGNIWILAIDGLHKIDTAGNLTGPFLPTPASTIMSMAIDHTGDVWTLADDGLSTTLNRFDSNLSQVASVLIHDAVAFALDGKGQPRVLREIGTHQDLSYYTRSANLAVTYQVASTGGTFGSIAVDWGGNSWLAGVGGNGIQIFRSNGQLRGAVGGTPSPAWTGDRTGLHLLSVLDRNGDPDGDGLDNEEELFFGGDMLDPLVPPQLVTTNSTPTLNETITITMPTTDPAGHGYVIAAAEATGSFEITPLNQSVPLDPNDSLLSFWLSPTNFLATGVYGVLDGAGTGTSSVLIPNYPLIIGATFWFSGVTTDLSGVPSLVAPALPITVQ